METLITAQGDAFAMEFSLLLNQLFLKKPNNLYFANNILNWFKTFTYLAQKNTHSGGPDALSIFKPLEVLFFYFCVYACVCVYLFFCIIQRL